MGATVTTATTSPDTKPPTSRRSESGRARAAARKVAHCGLRNDAPWARVPAGLEPCGLVDLRRGRAGLPGGWRASADRRVEFRGARDDAPRARQPARPLRRGRQLHGLWRAL